MLSHEISKFEVEMKRRIGDMERRLERKIEDLNSKVEERFKRSHEEFAELRERQAKLENYVSLVTKRGVWCFGRHLGLEAGG